LCSIPCKQFNVVRILKGVDKRLSKELPSQLSLDKRNPAYVLKWLRTALQLDAIKEMCLAKLRTGTSSSSADGSMRYELRAKCTTGALDTDLCGLSAATLVELMKIVATTSQSAEAAALPRASYIGSMGMMGGGGGGMMGMMGGRMM
jgi:hypothetical protein